MLKLRRVTEDIALNENRDLFSYLEEQAGGGLKDSQGEFTISLEQARSKLAKFSLPRPEAWGLKLVQAAVGWNMKRVSISQTRRESEIYFEPANPEILPTEHELLRALLSGQIMEGSPLAQFCLALRALVEQAKLSFLLVVNRGQELPQPLYAGSYYSRLSERARLGRTQNKGFGLTLLVRHKKSAGFKPPIERRNSKLAFPSEGFPLIEELRNYAYICPIPIEWEGVLLSGIMDSQEHNFHWQTPLALSGVRSLERSPDRLPLPSDFEEKQFSFLTNRRRAARNYGGRREFACAYSLFALAPNFPSGVEASRYSSFHWVTDGVVVQSEDLPVETRSLALRVYANANGLQSDLTGFQLVRNQQLIDRRREILHVLSQSVLQWQETTEGFFRVDRDEHSDEDDRLARKKLSKKRNLAVALGSGGLLGFAAPPFGAMIGMYMILGSVIVSLQRRNESKKMKVDWNALKEKLEQDLVILSEGLAQHAEET